MRAETSLPPEGERMAWPILTKVVITCTGRKLAKQERLVHGAPRESRVMEADGGYPRCCQVPRGPGPRQPHTETQTPVSILCSESQDHIRESLHIRKLECYCSLTMITAPYLSRNYVLRALCYISQKFCQSSYRSPFE